MDNTFQRDFFYYRRWSYEAPIGILVSILIAGLICIILTWIGRVAVRSVTEERIPWGLRFFIDGLRDLTLRTTNFLLFEFEHAKKEGENEYRLYGVQVHLFVLQYLFIVLLTIISVTLLSFWNTFLADTSVDQCDTLSDCFPIHRGTETPIQATPITDCDDFPTTENVSVLCFRVVYRYSEGLGEAGGFLFSMQVVTNILIYAVLRTVRTVLKFFKIVILRKKGEPMSDAKRKKYVSRLSMGIRILAVIVVLIIYCTLIVLVPLWLFSDRQDFRETLRTPQRQLQLFLYEYTIFVLFLVPPIVGAGIYGSRTFEGLDVETYTQCTKPAATELKKTAQESNSAQAVVSASDELAKTVNSNTASNTNEE